MLGAFKLPMPLITRERKTTWRTLPNVLTIIRILLIVPFAWFCIYGYDLTALCIFFIAAITDALDGALARRFDQKSKFGRLADPMADKALATTAFIVLSFFREGRMSIPIWVTIAVVARDVLILAGCLIVYLATRSTAFAPNVYGKVNTLIEIGTIVCVLLSSAVARVGSMMPVLYVLLMASLILSASGYAIQGLRMIRQSGHASERR
jgi:cardiolipin synthase